MHEVLNDSIQVHRIESISVTQVQTAASRDMCLAPPKANISFIFATPAISSSRPARHRLSGRILAWVLSRCRSVRAFRSTDTSQMDEAFYVLEGSGIFTSERCTTPF